MCRSCATRATLADPAFQARRLAALRAKLATPEYSAVQRAASRRREDERRGDPAWHAYKVASGHRLRAAFEADPQAIEKVLATRARAGEKIRRRRLPWCPPDRVADYHRLRKKVGAVDAKRVLLEEIAAQERAREAALTPLERQIKRLRAGAQLVTVVPMRRPDPEGTLGGVGSGLL